MKKLYFKLLICVIIVLSVGCLAVGCNTTSNLGHYDHLVTFNYNYGNMDADCPEQYLGVLDGSKIVIQPGYSAEFKLGSVVGYSIEGWYTARYDEDGNPIKDENGVVLLDAKWDFKTQTVTEDITLYAKLLKDVKLNIVERGTGTVVTTYEGRASESMEKPQINPKKSGWTFTGKYYAGESGEDEFEWPHRFGEADENVYVEFIEGDWNIVRTAKELNSALRNNNKAICLLNDITYDGDTAWVSRSYNGTLNGNGHKISGISVNLSWFKGVSNYSGVFSSLGAKANIYNVTFENVDVTFESSSSVVGIKVALFADDIADGAVLNNVTVSGVLKYKGYGGLVSGTAFANTNNSTTISDCDYSQVNIEES